MSVPLLRSLNHAKGSGAAGVLNAINKSKLSGMDVTISNFPIQTSRAHYSRRSDSKNLDSAFKTVKSKMRVQDHSGILGGECGPNWELLAPRGNRFYFPNAIGPAWQGNSTTMHLEIPLENLVDFEGKGADKNSMLQFDVSECPSLLKKSLHELFPTPEVVSTEKLGMVTLRFKGDTEMGASKFVLAAKEITSRLRLHGYWADFMNPFSGKPFYSWANGRKLYKVDVRFRGLNMKLVKKNHCTVISTEDADRIFSGAIYTNAPANYNEMKLLIDKPV